MSEQAQQSKPEEVRVTVNEQFVVLASADVTGETIKETAIREGVPIEQDFVLSETRPNGEQKIIPDDHKIHVKTGDQFWAIPGDDNS